MSPIEFDPLSEQSFDDPNETTAPSRADGAS
jgi:hypothetical protein